MKDVCPDFLKPKVEEVPGYQIEAAAHSACQFLDYLTSHFKKVIALAYTPLIPIMLMMMCSNIMLNNFKT